MNTDMDSRRQWRNDHFLPIDNQQLIHIRSKSDLRDILLINIRACVDGCIHISVNGMVVIYVEHGPQRG